MRTTETKANFVRGLEVRDFRSQHIGARSMAERASKARRVE
jgi:hypothetical protein